MSHEGGSRAVPASFHKTPQQVDIREDGSDPRGDGSQGFSHDVFRALVEVLNSRNPDVGEDSLPVGGAEKNEEKYYETYFKSGGKFSFEICSLKVSFMRARSLENPVAGLLKVSQGDDLPDADFPLGTSPPDPVARGLLLGVDLPVGQQLLPTVLRADNLKVNQGARVVELFQIQP